MLDELFINGKKYETGMALKSDLKPIADEVHAIAYGNEYAYIKNGIVILLDDGGEVKANYIDIFFTRTPGRPSTKYIVYKYQSLPPTITTRYYCVVEDSSIGDDVYECSVEYNDDEIPTYKRGEKVGVIKLIQYANLATKDNLDATVGSDPDGKTLHEKVDELYQSVGKDPQNPLSEDSTPRTLHWKVSELAAIVASWIVEKWDVFSGKFDSFKADWDSRKDTIAKQGNNPEATNSAILGKVEGIATDISALDADVLQGKRKLAAAITQKGVRTAYTESLSDMAINVSAIPQTTYTGDSNFDAMVMPSEYMWNVYKIAENLIGNNPYPYANRFFVAEYYRGYDSLVLSGADAYLTCDGDFYEVMGEQCIHTRPDGTQEVLEGKDPNHIWHDSDNGKMNRYVIFFFQADTYTFSNTTSAICPRRVAISGNCASFIVTGENRLTDVYVLGTLGNLEGGTTGDSWSPAQVIRNYETHSNILFKDAHQLLSCVMPETKVIAGGVIFDMTKQSGSNIHYYENLREICLPNLHSLNGRLFPIIPFVSTSVSGYVQVAFANLTHIDLPIKSLVTPLIEYVASYNAHVFPSLSYIRLDECEDVNTEVILCSGGDGYTDKSDDYKFNNLKVISLAKVKRINNQRGLFKFAGSSSGGHRIHLGLERIYTPELESVAGYLFESALGAYGTGKWGYEFTNLIDIEVGEMKTNLNVKYWEPFNVIDDTAKLAQLNANIRDHIAAKVSDRTGQTALTFTVSTNLYNNLEQATLDAFTAKNWRVAGA